MVSVLGTLSFDVNELRALYHRAESKITSLEFELKACSIAGDLASWSKGMSDAADIVESKKDRDLAEIIRISRDMVVAAQPVSFKEPSQCP